MRELIVQLQRGQDLTEAQAHAAFTRIMAGNVAPAELGALLCALASKGETVSELVGAARAMRAAATHVRCSRPCLCTCGTGGDGISTFNVSTTAAIIAAAAGAVVAKHGNRTNTRVSGSAELLSSLGVNIDADVPTLERCLTDHDIVFLYAPRLHPAMKHASAVRRAIRARTIFNLLGPLCNPAGASRQVVGVSRLEHVRLMAEALLALGAERAWVVHGNGLCDLTVTGSTHVAQVANGEIAYFDIRPEAVGLARSGLDALLVHSSAESAAAVREILNGGKGPRRDHALLNAAAGLVVYGIATDLPGGIARAAAAIDSGGARERLDRLVRASHESA